MLSIAVNRHQETTGGSWHLLTHIHTHTHACSSRAVAHTRTHTHTHTHQCLLSGLKITHSKGRAAVHTDTYEYVNLVMKGVTDAAYE